jgi:hypothetical protein
LLSANTAAREAIIAMADPAALSARPAAQPGEVFPTAAGARPGTVPLSIWPAVPSPGSCPASPQPVPCPQRYSAEAAAVVITAFSRPADLVVIAEPGAGALVAAVARAGRRVLGLAATTRASRDLAALAIATDCPAPGCPPPAPAGHAARAEPFADSGVGPGVLYAACQRMLAPGGLLVVITSTARHPAAAGEVIARARAAGLAYAQHIIAMHARIRGGCLAGPWPVLAGPAPGDPGLHRSVHTDLLVFTQPGTPASSAGLKGSQPESEG